MKKYFVEFIGTFFLVLTVAFSANPIAIGLVLAAMIYMGGYISGAHYNPAITLAVFIQRKISGRDSVAYIISQLIGAVLASVVFLYVKGTYFVVQPGTGYTFWHVFLLEALFTFALASVVLHTAVSKANTPNQYYGLAIGATVLAGAFSVGAITGGAFNPAVGIAPLLTNIATISQHSSLLLLYIAAPCFGSALASIIFSNIPKGK
jgi:aquaporin Z